jgi:hypothetical protein
MYDQAAKDINQSMVIMQPQLKPNLIGNKQVSL